MTERERFQIAKSKLDVVGKTKSQLQIQVVELCVAFNLGVLSTISLAEEAERMSGMRVLPDTSFG